MLKGKRILACMMAVAMTGAVMPYMSSAALVGSEVVWEEGFEDKALGYNVIQDSAHWDRAQMRGGDAEKVTATATVEGTNGNKYLKLAASVNENETIVNSTTMITATKSMTELGLAENAPYTISYDFKTEKYNQAKMVSGPNITEYQQSLSSTPEFSNGGNPTTQLYFYHRASADNKETFLVHGDCKITGTAAPSGDIYTNGWNSVQWVVHASANASEEYADLYLNGLYRGSLKNRRGTLARYLVFGITLKSGVQEGAVYIDNIKVINGDYTKADTAKNAMVTAINADFEDMVAKENGIDKDVTVMPGIAQPSYNYSTNNDSAYVTFAAENGFGRTDKALHISNTTVPEGVTVASKDTNMKFGLIDNADVTSSKLYSPGDTQEITFDFAFDENAGPLAITAGRVHTENNTVTASDKVEDLIRIEKETIKVKINTVSGSTRTWHLEKNPLVSGKWYNIRVLFTRGEQTTTNTATIYLTRDDGVVDSITMELGECVNGNGFFRGVREIWLHYKWNNVSAASGVWYDNFSIKSYIGGAAAPVLKADEAISLDVEDGTATASITYTENGKWGAKLILAVYDGKLLENVCFDTESDINGLRKLSAQLRNIGEGKKVKAMLFDDFTSLNALRPVVEK